MISSSPIRPTVHAAAADVYARALDARDARFDGLFFVGITTTRIYCRPVCPARVAYQSHRRFFPSAAAAEGAGFRPCLRCRPELAPGCALVDAVPRLAHAAAQRIADGALNGRSVAALAGDLGVSERHLRRALERELGVSALELAQTHRLLLAKRLLADTALPVTRVAYASGFESLRRFNTVFRERYRMSPSALRRAPSGRRSSPARQSEDEPLRLTLAYRAPFAWDALLEFLRHDAIRGVELIEGRRYVRTVEVDGRSGIVSVEDAGDRTRPRLDDGLKVSSMTGARRHVTARGTPAAHVLVEISPSLVPALMPLLARLRHLFDLDAEPSAIDAHLTQGGLGALVARRPGLRIPGAIDGFEIAMRALLRGRTGDVANLLGETLPTTTSALVRLMPSAARVANAGADRLTAIDIPRLRAEALVAVARLVTEGALRLEPGSDVTATHRALAEIPGVDERTATTIVMRALDWPDAFPATDRTLWRAAGVSGARALLACAERWRPWRAYAAMHLWMRGAARTGGADSPL